MLTQTRIPESFISQKLRFLMWTHWRQQTAPVHTEFGRLIPNNSIIFVGWRYIEIGAVWAKIYCNLKRSKTMSCILKSWNPGGGEGLSSPTPPPPHSFSENPDVLWLLQGSRNWDLTLLITHTVSSELKKNSLVLPDGKGVAKPIYMYVIPIFSRTIKSNI